MARIQILELPDEWDGENSKKPFVIILDQVTDSEAADLAKDADSLIGFKEDAGARSIAVFPMTVEIPANEITLGPDGTPLRLHFEGDFSKVYEQADEVAKKLQHRFKLGAS